MKLKQEQQREYLFDNYKVLLIILVVIGHFIEPCYDQNSFLYEDVYKRQAIRRITLITTELDHNSLIH